MDEINLEYQGIPTGNCSETFGSELLLVISSLPTTMYCRSPGNTKYSRARA
jgi:hypothetical protein